MDQENALVCAYPRIKNYWTEMFDKKFVLIGSEESVYGDFRTGTGHHPVYVAFPVNFLCIPLLYQF